MAPDPSPSYRALLAVPSMPSIVTSLFLSRTGQAMARVGLILFTLAEFGSPTLAGVVTFALLVPGILASPIAGALLDRHGRVRLIALDFVVAMVTMASIGGLSMAGLLSPALLVVIAAVASLTAPLSLTGLRSLFPIIVPRRLWERVNAVDANGFVTANMMGPPLAAGLIVFLGPGAAVMAIGIWYGLAALALRGVPDPDAGGPATDRLLASAWQGLRYTVRNRTLRGLGVAISTLMFAFGVLSIVVPLIVLEQLGGSELAVGGVLGLAGLASMGSVLVAGRLDSRGREWRMLVLPMLAMAPTLALLLVAAGPLGAAQPLVGGAVLAFALVVYGLLEGPLDIGLFTIRQRRTHPGWIGRAFAISMAVNALGLPVGALVAGALAERSIEAAILVAVAACLAAAAFVWLLVPRHDPSVDADGLAPAEPVPPRPAAGDAEVDPTPG